MKGEIWGRLFFRSARIVVGRLTKLHASGLKAGMALVGALSVAATSAPAIAQNQENSYGGGSRLGPRGGQITQSGTGAARVVLKMFAQCVYDRRSGSAEQFMSLPTDTAEYTRLSRKLFDEVGDSCIEGDGELQFSSGLLRGALFEAAYQKKYGAKATTDFQTAGSTSVAARYGQPYSSEAKKQIALQDFADCAVRTDPAAARSLVMSSPDSAREAAAIGSISAKLSPCLVKGKEAKFSKPSFRGIVAEALYRVTAASAVPPKPN